MDARTEQYLNALEGAVTEAQRLMEVGVWTQAKEKLESALTGFEEAGLVMEPEHEWLRLQSLHAECVFWLGEFERAEAAFEAASSSRSAAGLLDWDWVRQRRYVALSKRGLCDFKGCIETLKAAQATARKKSLTELISHLEEDIKTTEFIRQGVFHNAAFAARAITLVGPNGVEVLGDDRIPLQGCPSLNHLCSVSQCSFIMGEPFRLQVHLRFVVDNDVPISVGPESDGYPGSRTPIMFGFLLPKGAAIHHGDFSLELNHPEPKWREDFFFLQNEFATVFHPESYPPNGFHPIPRCKTYRYVQGDCCFFRCPLPRKAEVSFAGTITYPAQWAGGETGSTELAAAVLLPYRKSRFASVEAACSAEGMRSVRSAIARASFIADRINYSPGVTPLAPEEGLGVGESTPLNSTNGEVRKIEVPSSEVLTVSLRATLDRDFLVSLQHHTHVVPTGTFNYLSRPRRRNPGGGISLADDTVEPVPLLSCILLNNQDRSRSVDIAASCDDLFSQTSQRAEVPSGGIAVVDIRPKIDSGRVLFARQGDRDHDCLPQKIQASVVVKERRMAGLVPPKPLAERSIELTALPGDYMVWAVANRADHRFINLRKHIARWVTPQAPAIQAFIASIQNDFPDDPAAPFDAPLRRIYEGLRALGFTYESKKVNFGTSMEHDFQRVRLPAKSLVHRQINCIDGTVLLASVMEAVGYRPAVIFIPGHAFLALLFGDGLDNIKRILCLESTGLCSAKGDPNLTYEHSSRVGLAQFSKYQGNLVGQGRDIVRYELVPIEQSRADGIEAFGD